MTSFDFRTVKLAEEMNSYSQGKTDSKPLFPGVVGGSYLIHTTDTEFSVTNLFYLHLSD